MGVTVSLPLFAGPGRELEEGGRLSGRHLRDLAERLRERLLRAADVVDTLPADGWSCSTALYDAVLAHPEVHTQEEAERRLRALGVGLEEVMIVEDVEDET